MATARRIPNGSLSFLAALVLLIILGGGERAVTAQSPVAELPPIKLVRISERLCPASVDPSTGTWQQARTTCPQAIEGMVFTLASSDASYVIPLAVNTRGETEWHEVPFGVPYSIGRAASLDYGVAWVACRFASNLDPCGSRHRANLSSVREQDRHRRRRAGPGNLHDRRVLLVRYPEDRGIAGGVGHSRSPLPSIRRWLADTQMPACMPNRKRKPDASPGTSEVAQQDRPRPPPQRGSADPEGARVDIRGWQCPFHVDLRGAVARPACGLYQTTSR